MNTIKLNIGSKDTELEGFTAVDRQFGQEAFPLDYADESVDEIRASHILEHFPHEQVQEVLNDWVRVLKPGGIIKIAVPDLGALCHSYVEDKHLNYQGFIMGGHVDENDYHGAVFDKETLESIFFRAGIERIRGWKADIQDCAAYPWSLNLMGQKPTSTANQMENVGAVLACPRYGPVMHFRSITELGKSGADVKIIQGCFWWQQLADGMEQHLKAGHKYILTADYDSIFTVADVLELYRTMEAFPDIDALCALQCKRGDEGSMLFNVNDDESKEVKMNLGTITSKVRTGHFGLTMIRAESLKRCSRPWMQPRPNPEGLWTDGQTDVDIDFWHNWESNNLTLHIANRIPIGHLAEMIMWPDGNMKPVYQDSQSYMKGGKPKEVWT